VDNLSDEEKIIFNAIAKKDKTNTPPQLLLETNMSRSYGGHYGYTVYEPLPNGELRLVGYVGDKI